MHTGTPRRRWLRGSLLLAALLLALPAAGQTQRATQQALATKGGPLATFSTDLARIYYEHAAHAASRSAVPFETRTASGQAVSDYVVVDVVARGGASERLLGQLEGLGLRNGAAFGAVVSGRLPVDALGALADLPLLASASTSAMMVNVGAVDGEASVALGAEAARAAEGVDGTGVTMGILSDSYDALGGAAADIASGDLPDHILVLEDLPPGAGIDEGRAMMQLAYDVAPGVNFAFSSAFFGQANFAQSIIDLANAGADVIVDDIRYLIEPFFQDGIIAQAVDEVARRGVPYYSSAGNYADDSYEAPFVDSGLDAAFNGGAFPGDLHDFDPTDGVDAFAAITLAPFQQFRPGFEWDEPFLAADPTGTTGSSSDYDIYVVDAPSVDATILAGSAADNLANGNPAELFTFTNFGTETITVYIAITRFAGPDAGLMKWIDYGSGVPFEYDQFGKGTTIGHANAGGGFATGASAWFNTPAFNDFVQEAAINGFSSFGGVPILFDVFGNRLPAPVVRDKPNAVASDGDNNTFFGLDSSVDADLFPNFFGTSAAAPNTAAVTALMLENAPAGVAPDQLYGLLESTADDITNVQGFNVGAGPGYDVKSGYGFVRGDLAIPAAAGLASTIPSIVIDPAAYPFRIPAEGARLEVTVTISNPTSERLRSQVWFTLIGPGGIFGLAGPVDVRLRPGASITESIRPLIGARVPAGTYVLTGNIGTFPSDINATDGAAAVKMAPMASARAAGETPAVVEGGFDVLTSDGAPLTGAVWSSDDLAGESAPAAFGLMGNYPNPFTAATSIRFGLDADAAVSLTVYDALGRRVATLANEAPFEAGTHTVDFDGRALASGIYLVRLSTGDRASTQSITLLK